MAKAKCRTISGSSVTKLPVSTNAAGSADLRRPQKPWHQLLADQPDRVIDTRARFRAPLQIDHGILQ
jgi:hypothetical protein